MAKKDAPATEQDQPARRSRRTLLLAGPLALVLAGGGFFLLGPGAGADEPKAVEPGEVLALEPITMNLSDGRLLKVGLALQLPADVHEEVNGSKALDEAISFLGSHSYAQLVAPAAREKAKDQLSHRVAERYHDEVMEVYFTEFVMQ